MNKLTKHSDPQVQNLASKLVKEWKTHFEEKLDRPMIEVRCDKQTEKLRKTGCKLLAGALSLNVSTSIYCHLNITIFLFVVVFLFTIRL